MSPSGAVGLGHTRLAIIDPQAAQPIENEDGTRRIIVNGEFYGFEATRSVLQRRGHRFRTLSDSEIALHLYEDHGFDCLEELRGQFAFVIWDESSGTLFAARDRFGMKPLFYHQGNDGLYLASEAKALFAAGIAPAWDGHGVYHMLHACPAEERSLFLGISQVPPGHMLVSTDFDVRVVRYWDVPAFTRTKPLPEVDRSTCTEKTRSLLEESVRLRMRADVPVGCLLSGGLDSSAILGIAATCTDEPVAAFTVGFDQPGFDETAGAHEMTAYAGAEHHVVQASQRRLADSFASAVAHAESVQFNSHGTARFLLSQGISQRGYKSVLAGEGADELFLGYQFARAISQAPTGTSWRRWFLMAYRWLRPFRGRYSGLSETSPWLARLASLLDLSPDLLSRLNGGLELLRSLYSPSFLQAFQGYDVYQAYYLRCKTEADIGQWEAPRQLIYLWLHSIFVNYHLAADRLDMAHGVEVRLPFLDHRLFEYVNQLPVSILDSPQAEKQLLRDAAKPYISDAVYTRKKRPFWAPPASSTGSDPLHEMVQDTLRGDAMKSVPFFDHGEVLSLLDNLQKGAGSEWASVDSLFLGLASLAVLQEHFGLSI